jgi:hypothetical protein
MDPIHIIFKELDKIFQLFTTFTPQKEILLMNCVGGGTYCGSRVLICCIRDGGKDRKMCKSRVQRMELVKWITTMPGGIGPSELLWMVGPGYGHKAPAHWHLLLASNRVTDAFRLSHFAIVSASRMD